MSAFGWCLDGLHMICPGTWWGFLLGREVTHSCTCKCHSSEVQT